MILKKIVLERIMHPRIKIFHFPRKQIHKELLKMCFSYLNVVHCNFCTQTNWVTELFDTAEVQKYLSFIANERCHLSKFDHVIQLLENRKNLETEIQNLENMSSEGNKELENLIKYEKEQYLESVKQIKNEILLSVMQDTEDINNRNVELQILPGIGGEESRNFSAELYQMYINYSEYKNWKCSFDCELNYILITGEFVYGHLKHEAGVHRVQRVPETEKSGRTHTSTCSVVVLPQPKENEIHISEKDLAVERMRSTGPGGQNVNKRETCVRITHIPSGLVVERQTSRFQHENMKEAIKRLKVLLFNIEQQKLLSERKTMKKEQVGTNDYSDKIRTYNYPQNRVTDHRISYTSQNLKGFLLGNKELDQMITQVREFNIKKEFLCHVNKVLQSNDYKTFERKKKI